MRAISKINHISHRLFAFSTHSDSKLTALSPLDGRYQSAAASLSQYFSQSALMKYRILVESEWLLHLLSKQVIPSEGPNLTEIQAQLYALVKKFNSNSAKRIKQIENTTNHDLKSVQYFMKENISHYKESIHFCCTSQDVNNLAYALMLRDSLDKVLLPSAEGLNQLLLRKSQEWAADPMLAHTHGQPATPTTLGKQYANFTYRLARQLSYLRQAPILGKFNGAVGNYNAHYFSYPLLDWPTLCRSFVQDRLKLNFNPYTTQIEPHDSLCRIFTEVGTYNTILIGLCRDSWEYISKGYLQQKTKEGEVGSSTMPHKVNPIDFENCEGNLGLANSLIDHFKNKLPISRQQRDLSDSTVLRNQGVALGYSLIAYNSLAKGLSKVESNRQLMQYNLQNHYEVITEAIQTELRKVGYLQPYQLLKNLSRGRPFTLQTKQTLLKELKGKIPDQSWSKIDLLTPLNYLGSAQALARGVSAACSKLK